MSKLKFITNYFGSYADYLPFYVKSTGMHHSKKGQRFDYGRQAANEINLIWLTAGQARFWFGEQEVVLSKDQVFLSFPHEEYSYIGLSEELEYRWLILKGSLAVVIAMSYGFPHVMSSYVPYPGKLFDSLESLCHVKSLFAQRRAVAVVMDILAHADGYTMRHSESENLVVRAEEYIKLNLSDPWLSVEAIAERFQVSQTRLNKAFRAYNYPSPGRYILEMRLIRARELMLGTDLPVSEMCRQCGYSDPHTFTRFIKRAYGLPPLQFRKRQAELHEKGKSSQDDS